MTTLDEFQLCGDRINAIHYIVVDGEVDVVGILWHIEHLVTVDDAAPVDVVYAFGSYIHLMAANGRKQGVYLPVDISEAYTVVVEKVEFAHTAAGEYLHYVSTDASHTEDGYTRAIERVDGRFTHQELCPGKLILHFGCKVTEKMRNNIV